MSLPHYPEYKPSGVEWLGDVPVHWRFVRLKDVASVINGYPFDSKLFGIEGKYPLIRIRDLDASETDTQYDGDFVEAVAVDRSDILIGMDGDFNVGRWLGEGQALLNQRMCCVRTNSHALRTILRLALPIPLKAINDLTYATTVKHLSSFDVEKIRFALPATAELDTIAAFLDRETSKIDALVAEQERLIDLLKEKRQAVISHTVTKGLNPDAPMKPSGIEWLGNVPTHWEVRALRTLSSVVRGASPRPAGDPTLFNGDFVSWVTVAEITKDGDAELHETADSLTKKGAEASRLFRAGCVIYSNSGATLGVPKVLRIDACANDGVVGFESLDRALLPIYLYHYLFSLTLTIREMVKQGSGQPNLNTDIVKAIPIALPPPEEQQAIAAFLKAEGKIFTVLVAEIQSAIDLLKERRSALISAAVTGQIDVRQVA